MLMFKRKTSIRLVKNGLCCSTPIFAQDNIFTELLNSDGERRSDVYYLFHQKHLDKLNPTSLQYYLDKLREPYPSNPFQGFSDDELMAVIKSRRCNTFSDMKRYLDNCVAQTERAREFREDFIARAKKDSEVKSAKEKFKSWIDSLGLSSKDSE